MQLEIRSRRESRKKQLSVGGDPVELVTEGKNADPEDGEQRFAAVMRKRQRASHHAKSQCPDCARHHEAVLHHAAPQGNRAKDARTIDLMVDEAELAKRRKDWKAPAKPKRGYARLYIERVTQADKGCDFDFLAGTE